MKAKKLYNLTSLISIIFMTSGCSNNVELNPPISGDCRQTSFINTYIHYFRNDDIFFIKGIALNVNKYGREIKVIEDLKGNFDSKSSIFIWGAGHSSEPEGPVISNERYDNLVEYEKNDTLLIFFTKVHRKNDIEKVGDYGTLQCAPSVLKFSNGFVTGAISNWDRLLTMSWKEFQMESQAFLNLTEKPSWWLSKGFTPDPFSIVYKAMKNSDDFFFIKGFVLDTYQLYGKNIQLITDLKGNFPKKTSTFIAWGDPNPVSNYSDRFDDLQLYSKQDTLLMLLFSAPDLEKNFPDLVEKHGDYTTFPLAFSVLKLSNEYVSGYITSFLCEETMPWEELQALLNLTKKLKQ